MSIEGQGHFFTNIFQVLYVLCFTMPIYQVSVYRTIGPLVLQKKPDVALDIMYSPACEKLMDRRDQRINFKVL